MENNKDWEHLTQDVALSDKGFDALPELVIRPSPARVAGGYPFDRRHCRKGGARELKVSYKSYIKYDSPERT